MVDINANRERWEREVDDRLPALLDCLLASEVYGLGAGRQPPPETYGVYLFSENGEPRYVGRVGLTERSRLAGARYSSFRTRLRGHVRARHNEGTFAYALAVAAFRDRGLPLAGTRQGNSDNPEFHEEHTRQCKRVREMEFRVVEIPADESVLAATFEMYAATVLELPQSFTVS